MKTIRDTLLQSLFYSTPPFMGDLLAENENVIFPGREEIVLFLQEQDSQKRLDRAQKIMARLAYESEVLIPPELLDSILAAEERVGPAIAGPAYVPQDHFVHLIHLYLLGIYLFTHHKRLNRGLIKHFKSLRDHSRSALQLHSSEELAFKDFMFSWRSFVLLHDVAYPWEMDSKVGAEKLSALRQKYDKLTDLLHRQVGVAFSAKMATWQLVDHHQVPALFNQCAPDFYLRSDHGFLFKDTQMSKFQKALRIPIIHGRRFRGIVSSIVATTEMAALLVRSRNGEIVCALIPDGTGGHQQKPGTVDLKLSTADLVNMAFREGRTPREGNAQPFEWQLFVVNYETAGASLVDQLGRGGKGELDRDSLSEFGSSFSAGVPATIQSITSDRDFADCDFWIYKETLEWAKVATQNLDGIASSLASITQGTVSSHQRKIIPLLVNFIKERLVSHIDANPPTTDILKRSIHEYIDEVCKPLNDLKSLKMGFAAEFGESLKADNERELLRRRVFSDLMSLGPKVWTKSGLTTLSNRLSGGLADPTELSGLKALDERLKRIGLNGLGKLLVEYRPGHLKPDSHDHGLAGAVLVLAMQDHMLEMLGFAMERQPAKTNIAAVATPEVSEDEKRDTVEEAKAAEVVAAIAKFIRVATNIGDETEARERQYQYTELLVEVAHAVAVHNLYPAKMNSSRFRVDSSSPFAFFSMLCDGLQTWDRDARLWQSEVRLPYKTTSDTLNITVDGDKIRVTEADYGIDISKREKALKDNFESYLKGARDYLSIELGEWKKV